MGGHLFGKFIVEVLLEDGTREYLMEVEDGYNLTTRNPDAAARFMTSAGAKKYYYSVYHMPAYSSNGAQYIVDAFVKITNHI